MARVRLLGIDIGTTGVRVAMFDEAARLLGDASVGAAFDSPLRRARRIAAERGGVRARPRSRSWRRRYPLADVTAIAVVGQAPTVALVDERGKSLGAAMLWLDTRHLRRPRSSECRAYYLGPKLLWLARARTCSSI